MIVCLRPLRFVLSSNPMQWLWSVRPEILQALAIAFWMNSSAPALKVLFIPSMSMRRKFDRFRYTLRFEIFPRIATWQSSLCPEMPYFRRSMIVLCAGYARLIVITAGFSEVDQAGRNLKPIARESSWLRYAYGRAKLYGAS